MCFISSKVEYDIVVIKDFMVPLGDDVQLATDIYRPARSGEAALGEFPTILKRTPYDMERKVMVEKADYSRAS